MVLSLCQGPFAPGNWLPPAPGVGGDERLEPFRVELIAACIYQANRSASSIAGCPTMQGSGGNSLDLALSQNYAQARVSSKKTSTPIKMKWQHPNPPIAEEFWEIWVSPQGN